MKALNHRFPCLLLVLASWVAIPASNGESVPEGLIGDWTLYLDTKEPAWLKVEELDGKPVVHMRVHVQSAGPHKIKEFKNGRLNFDMKIKREVGQGGPQTKI